MVDSGFYLTDLVRGFTSTGQYPSPWKANSKSVPHVLRADYVNLLFSTLCAALEYTFSATSAVVFISNTAEFETGKGSTHLFPVECALYHPY